MPLKKKGKKAGGKKGKKGKKVGKKGTSKSKASSEGSEVLIDSRPPLLRPGEKASGLSICYYRFINIAY